MTDKQPRPDIKELVREFRRSAGRKLETRVAVPLPPEPSKAARALEPSVRGGGQERPIDALELSRVFNLAELNAEEETEAAPDPKVPEGPEAQRLQGVPLFGSLPWSACVALASTVQRRALGAGEILFYEGQPARSLFIVAEGALTVLRGGTGRRAPTQLARIGPDDVVGVFGLFSGRRRAATLRADVPSVLLEIPGTALARLVKRHASARRAVRQFYQDRLLTVFLASSPVFGELPEAARRAIVGQFEARDVSARTRLVTPGELQNGLFLVMNGQLALKRRPHKDDSSTGRRGKAAKPEHSEEILRLGRGQFFGVISSLIGTPTKVSATASTAASLVVLSHPRFDDLLRSEPSLKPLPARLREEGLLVTRDVFIGDTGVPGLGGG